MAIVSPDAKTLLEMHPSLVSRESNSSSLDIIVHGKITGPGEVFPGIHANAAFNAAHLSRDFNGVSVQLGFTRIVTEEHIAATSDPTAGIFIEQFLLKHNGHSSGFRKFIPVADLRASNMPGREEYAVLNPEDLRMEWDRRFDAMGNQKIIGGATIATRDGVPYLGTIAGRVILDDANRVNDVEISPVQLVHVKGIDGKLHRVEGKNARIDWSKSGEMILEFRPEGEYGRNTFQYLKALDDGTWEYLDDELELPLIAMDNLLDVGYGINDKPIALGADSNLFARLDHFRGKETDGRITYGQMLGLYEQRESGAYRCIGLADKPFLTFAQLLRLTEISFPDLTGDKNVDYINGAGVAKVEYAPGEYENRLVVLLNLFDRTVIGVSFRLSYIINFLMENNLVKPDVVERMRRRTTVSDLGQVLQ